MTTTKLTGLEGLLPDGHHLLVSCFDAHHTIGGGLFAIGGAVEEIDRVSSTGLYAAGGLLYRCLWSAEGSPAELVAYDPTGVRRYHRLDDVSTPHDILVVDGDVLVVATTQNEVQRVAPDGEVVWRWRAPGEVDSWHLNSLAVAGDRILVCGFGPFLRRRGWDESGKPATGQVVDLATGEPVLQGLRAPHNPHYSDGTWLVCDSAAGDLVRISGETRREIGRLGLPGWPRGLAVTDDYLFVGVSPHRYLTDSVETAALAVVDRREWRVTGLVDLPAREVYALALVPSSLAGGARRGFDVNHTRAHEQGQRQMFERLGRKPGRLWAIGDRLPDEDCRAEITLAGPVEGQAETGSLMTVPCRIGNTGAGLLTPAPPYPVRVLHRWYDADGRELAVRPIAAALPRSLPPGGIVNVPVRARAPGEPGDYRLRITLTQDGGVPFDELDPSAGADVPVRVVADGPAAEALAAFGLRPEEVRAARTAGSTVHDMIRALLTRPGGGVNGLSVGLVEDAGRPAFVKTLATVLNAAEPALEHAVAQAVPASGDVLLTGAEAIALALHRAGAGIAFAGAGIARPPGGPPVPNGDTSLPNGDTSLPDGDTSLPDSGTAGAGAAAVGEAMARLGRFVGAGGDREALVQAGGACLLRPGNGVAVLAGARGLAGVLGALADLRRDGIGTIVVVGRPAIGSPTSPQDGEPDLLPVSGAFAKSWHELKGVPGDAEGRRAAVDALIAVLQQALDDSRRPPYGPVIVAVPQDVAEAAWVPLTALSALNRPMNAAPHSSSDPVPETSASETSASGIARAIGQVAGRAARQVVVVDDGRLLGGALPEEDGGPKVRVASGLTSGGVALATGLALGEPSVKVLCAVGGEEWGFLVQGLVAAVREAAPVTFVACHGGVPSRRPAGSPGDQGPGDALGYTEVAGALGVRSRRVDLGDRLDRDHVAAQLETFAATLRTMAAHPGPALVELVLPSGPEPPDGDRAGQEPEQDRTGQEPERDRTGQEPERDRTGQESERPATVPDRSGQEPMTVGLRDA
ncbi:DUF4915 domain-containing protein [Nonomuraea sp. NPDC002799]